MKALIAGIILGAATLVVASHKPLSIHSNIPIPLCPPDQPGCSLNQ